MTQSSNPYQEGPGTAGFPQPRPGPVQRRSANFAPLLLALGGVSFVVAIILQFVKVSEGGISLSASQANGICQSALGQLGQAVSSGFGSSSPSAVCGKAATIEDWKGVTVWLGVALVLAGLLVLGRRAGFATTRAAGPPRQSPEATLAAAERAEADAARLRAQAEQMRAQQAWTQNPPPPQAGFPGGSS